MLQFVATKFQKNIPETTVRNAAVCAEHGSQNAVSLPLSCTNMLDSSPESKNLSCLEAVLFRFIPRVEKLFQSKKEPQSVWFCCFHCIISHQLQR